MAVADPHPVVQATAAALYATYGQEDRGRSERIAAAAAPTVLRAAAEVLWRHAETYVEASATIHERLREQGKPEHVVRERQVRDGRYAGGIRAAARDLETMAAAVEPERATADP